MSESLSHSASITWQKIELEKYIRSKLEGALKGILGSEEVAIFINIENDEPDISELIEKEQQKAAAPASEKKNSSRDLPRVKLAEKLDAKDRESYLMLHKLGMSVLLPVDEIQLKKDKQKNVKSDLITPVSQASSNNSNPYHLFLKTDLFRYLEEVSIKVFFKRDLPKSLRDRTESILKNIPLNLAGVDPEWVFEYGDIPVASEKKVGVFQKLIDALLSSSGIILSVLFIGALLFLISRKLSSDFQELGKQFLDKDSESASIQQVLPPSEVGPEKEKEKEEKDILKQIPPQGASLSPRQAMRISQKANKQFSTLIKEDFDKAITLVKKWVQSSEPTHAEVVKEVFFHLEEEYSQKVINALAEDDKRQLKLLMQDSGSASKNSGMGGSLLLSEIIGEIALPSDKQAILLQSELSRLGMDLIKKYIKSHLDLGSQVLNYLTREDSLDVISSLSEDELKRVLSVHKESEPISILQSLEKFTEDDKLKTKTSFQEGLPRIVEECSAIQEPLLIGFLAQQLSDDQLGVFARTHFPVEIIEEFEVETIKMLSKSYPIPQKARLLASMSEDHKMFDKVKEAFDEKGSKSSDVLQFELEKYQDEKEKQIILKKFPVVWDSYIKFLRMRILEEKLYEREDISEKIDLWVARSQTENETLKAA